MSVRIETIDTPGPASIVVEIEGHGDPLVLVHGISESRRAFDAVVPALAARHQVLRLDLRGHGESSDGPGYGVDALAGDVAAVVAQLALDAPLLVGHSLGGAVVSLLAAGLPCRGVVNVDQSLRIWELAAELRPLESELLGPGFHTALAGVFDARGLGAVPEPERSRLETMHEAARPEVVLGVWDLLLHSSDDELRALVEAAAAEVGAPYLSLHGQDPGPGYERWLTGLAPGAEVEVWDGNCHWPHLVEPDRFAERVARFAGA